MADKELHFKFTIEILASGRKNLGLADFLCRTTASSRMKWKQLASLTHGLLSRLFARTFLK